MKRAISATLAATLLASGCATHPFKPGAPLQVEGSFLSRRFVQDGQTVDPNSVVQALEKREDARDSVSSSRPWYWISIVGGGAGGFLVGYSLTDTKSSSSTRTTEALVGAGLLAGGLAAAALADHYLVQGVETYNRGIAAKSAAVRFAPFTALTQGGTVLGLALSLPLPVLQ
jgi:hypothetical protein